MPIINVNTPEEFAKALAEAKGPTAIEFTAEGCEYCEEEKPKVEKLANDCANITIVRADADKLSDLADKYLGDDGGTPTLYYAKTAAELAGIEDSKAAEKFELRDSSALRRRLKCARKPREAAAVEPVEAFVAGSDEVTKP